jgi:hypothetical protein
MEKLRNTHRNSSNSDLLEQKPEPLFAPNSVLWRDAVRNDFRQKRTAYCGGKRETLLIPHKLFLKDSWACLSALACRGRGTFCLNPSWCTKSQVVACPKEMPNSLSMAGMSFCKVQKMGLLGYCGLLPATQPLVAAVLHPTWGAYVLWVHRPDRLRLWRQTA